MQLRVAPDHVPHLVADLHNLNEDGQRQAEEDIADKSPSVTKLPVNREGRDVAHPCGIIHVHCKERKVFILTITKSFAWS